MKIQLSEHFTYSKLFKFVIPSIIMMIFTSVYGVIDGLFVSNFVGKTSFAAVNLIMPFPMILGSVGFMFGTGGSAVVAKTLGEGDKTKANKFFSLFVYATIISGVVFSAVGLIFAPQIAKMMGAEGYMLEECIKYGNILLIALPFFMLQNVFQSFFSTAQKPTLGLIITVCAGLTNILLDYIFIVIFNAGVTGAAVATALSQVVGGVVPVVYFIMKNNSLLRLCKTYFDWRTLLKACLNGSSELMTNLSLSLVNMLYNIQLMSIAGENGVAAYGVIMYVNFIFIAIFLGYSIGCAPLIGYNYGSQNISELKNLFRKSIFIISGTSVILTAAAVLLSSPLSMLFVGYDKELYEMTNHGFIIYSLSFIFCGMNIFGSAFFTALNNGIVSAVISFLRTLLFQIVVVLTLPLILGLNGIWLSVVVAEMLALIVTIIFFIIKRKQYKYI